jgi:hypothetical protein
VIGVGEANEVSGGESGDVGEGSEETMEGEWAVLWGPAVGPVLTEQCRRTAEQCRRQASRPQSPHETCPSRLLKPSTASYQPMLKSPPYAECLVVYCNQPEQPSCDGGLEQDLGRGWHWLWRGQRRHYDRDTHHR